VEKLFYYLVNFMPENILKPISVVVDMIAGIGLEREHGLVYFR
jgi:hypothetical protein